jgi:hypothetical protein
VVAFRGSTPARAPGKTFENYAMEKSYHVQRSETIVSTYLLALGRHVKDAVKPAL